MNYPKKDTTSVPEDSNRSRYALFACGLWLRSVAVGAFGLVGVLHQLFNGEMQLLSALALVVGFGVLMAMSWWRAQVALDRNDEADNATPAVSLPANAALGNSVA